MYKYMYKFNYSNILTLKYPRKISLSFIKFGFIIRNIRHSNNKCVYPRYK